MARSRAFPTAAQSPAATCVVAGRDREALEYLCRVLGGAGFTVVGSTVDGDESLRLVLELRPGMYFDGGLSGELAGSEASARPQLLTRREREILRLLADGLRIAEIGKRLYLSPDTIKVHLTKARRKLGARTTAEAVATAVRRSLIS